MRGRGGEERAGQGRGERGGVGGGGRGATCPEESRTAPTAMSATHVSATEPMDHESFCVVGISPARLQPI